MGISCGEAYILPRFVDLLKEARLKLTKLRLAIEASLSPPLGKCQDYRCALPFLPISRPAFTLTSSFPADEI